MKYNIYLTDEDYIRFNIFYANHSKTGKQSMLMARISLPFLAIAIIIVFLISGVSYGLLVTEAVFLGVASIVWFVYMPKMAEKNIRKKICKIKADGKLPFHEHAEIEFQDSMIVEKSEQEEIHVKYTDIQNIYLEKDYLYIFYSAVQAFIIPNHCLGEDKERLQQYILEKKA